MRDTYYALKKEESMTDYLPEVYKHFQCRFLTVKEAFDALGAAEHDAGHPYPSVGACDSTKRETAWLWSSRVDHPRTSAMFP
jgi:hypothetical protein